MHDSLPVAGVVILAGGAGTRLRSVLADTQKVVAPVGGRPMLAFLLDQCRHAGVREVTLAVGYHADQVRAAIGDAYRGMRVRYSVEPSPLGTGGAIALAAAELGDGPVVVLNGDSFVDVDLAAALAWHRARRARASLVLTEVADSGRFGSVSVDADGRVLAFAEKSSAASGRGVINAGIYVLERDALRAFPAGAHSIERDVLPAFVGNGLYGWRVPGRFIDIGLPETYATAADVLGDSRVVTRRGFVVLDRDGTVIEERRYLHQPDEVALLAGAAEGLADMRANGFQLVLATNQAGIGRGLYSEDDFDAVQTELAARLAAHGVAFDAVLHCPHHPDAGCACRKPAPGMVDQARAQLPGAEPVAVIGDKRCDIELARAIGTPGILVTTGYGATELAEGLLADFVVDDLRGAAHVVDELSRHHVLTAAGA